MKCRALLAVSVVINLICIGFLVRSHYSGDAEPKLTTSEGQSSPQQPSKDAAPTSRTPDDQGSPRQPPDGVHPLRITAPKMTPGQTITITCKDEAGGLLDLYDIDIDVDDEEFTEMDFDASNIVLPIAHLPCEILVDYCDQQETIALEDQSDLCKEYPLVFHRKANILIHIADCQTVGHELLWARLDSQSEPQEIYSSEVDENCEADFPCIELGSYELSIKCRESPDSRQCWSVSTHKIDVTEAESDQEIVLPHLYNLSVTCMGDRDYYQTRLEGPEKEIYLMVKLPARKATWLVAGLPEGSYKLSASSIDGAYYAGEDVQLTRDTNIALHPDHVDCMRFSINNAQSYPYQAGLRDGDLLVGFGTDEFKSVQSLQWEMLKRATDSAPTDLLIQRGSSRISIRVDVRELLQADDGGVVPAAK